MYFSFSKFAGLYGIIAGIAGLAYLVLFFALKNPTLLLPALALLIVGIAASATLVAIYQRVREVDEGFALWGLLLAIGGAGGAAIHAAFDVANNFNPPKAAFDYANLVDPRGFLTFGVAGLGAIVLSWLIVRGGVLPRSVGYFGLLSGILLIALYLAYMIILNASNALVLGLIVLSGLAQPIWYLWIGWLLWQSKAPPMKASERP
jgi:hypothetical protein